MGRSGRGAAPADGHRRGQAAGIDWPERCRAERWPICEVHPLARLLPAPFGRLAWPGGRSTGPVSRASGLVGRKLVARGDGHGRCRPVSPHCRAIFRQFLRRRRAGSTGRTGTDARPFHAGPRGVGADQPRVADWNAARPGNGPGPRSPIVAGVPRASGRGTRSAAGSAGAAAFAGIGMAGVPGHEFELSRRPGAFGLGLDPRGFPDAGSDRIGAVPAASRNRRGNAGRTARPLRGSVARIARTEPYLGADPAARWLDHVRRSGDARQNCARQRGSGHASDLGGGPASPAGRGSVDR